MFGAEVVRRLRSEHPDALYTAHLEVPGEMFGLASDAAAEGRGVVGSTSNILAFIEDRVQQAINAGKTGIIPIVLGTEAGMITSIVDRVSERLRDCTIEGLGVEIIFPVSSDAIATDPESSLAFVPGVAAGEGCSAEGGCASCPYMKMNSLDALFELLKDREADGASAVLDYRPEKYQEEINGQTIANLGGEPILHMRWFQRTRNMPDALVDQICRQ